MREVRLRKRQDLRFQQCDVRGGGSSAPALGSSAPALGSSAPALGSSARGARPRWTVFDPISRQSYRIGLVEHWILTRADGRVTVEQLLCRLRRELPDMQLSDESVLNLFHSFLQSGLVLRVGAANASRSDGDLRLGFPETPKKSRVSSWLSSVVVWQIRGIQPDKWLGRIAPHTDCWFSHSAVRFWLLAACFTTLAVLLDFHRLSAQSLSLDWILHPSTGGMLFGVFLVTRGLHEMGHAVVCKRFGIRCPDIGVFVILGAPCVYCDVSESWQLPLRWQRATVAAAGMYVELLVATLAAWIWLATVAGPINTLAFQTMLVCSVSTLVINANPLMRFDGYYLLADWMDEVNLRQKADGLAYRLLQRCLLGNVESNQSVGWSARQRFLIVYSIAGWIYRGGLSLTIASVLVAIYGGWNLAWIGRFLACAIVFSWWGVPIVKLSRTLISEARRWGRGWRLAACVFAAVLIVAIVPVPGRRFASGWLQPLESQGVYAVVASKLTQCAVRDGEHVRAGQPLFRLENQELFLQQIRYQQANDIAKIRLEASRRKRDMHSQDISLNPFANEVNESQGRLAGVQRVINDLVLRAPMSGRLLAMPAENSDAIGGAISPPEVGVDEMGEAVGWCDPRQLERFVPEGTMLARVCSDESLAIIPLTESQLSDIAAGTHVRLRIPQNRQLHSQACVLSIVQLEQLSSPWQDPSLRGPATRFAAVIRIPADWSCKPGSVVDAVFVAEATTLASWAATWLRANLRLFAD